MIGDDYLSRFKKSGDSKMNASQIKSKFILLLNQAGESNNFRCYYWDKGMRRTNNNINIIELSGSLNCLIYFKVRSEKPYRWGITANRINELKQSNIKWNLILFYESPRTGYFITAEEVNHYLSIWPLGRDGDYKVAPGKCLQFNKPFNSFSEFLNFLLSGYR